MNFKRNTQRGIQQSEIKKKLHGPFLQIGFTFLKATKQTEHVTFNYYILRNSFHTDFPEFS